MKILLVGNPNVGKTTLFNALTGAHLRTGNYHGVTVGITKRTMRQRPSVTVCDLPGLYSLRGVGMEEKLAAEYIRAQTDDFLVVQVVDARRILQSRALTDELRALGVPLVVVLTMGEKLRRGGGRVDVKALSVVLGVDVEEVDAYSSKSVRLLGEFLVQAKGEVLQGGGDIFTAYTPRKDGGKAFDFLLSPAVALFCFFAVLAVLFFLSFGKGMLGDTVGAGMQRMLNFASVILQKNLKNPLLFRLAEGALEGVGGILAFLPQIALLYLAVTVIEESGFGSYLAYATDGLFSKIGLSGRAAFSILLGFGCVTAAIGSTKALEDRAAQKRTAACLYFLPCSAKMPVYLCLLGSLTANPFWGALLLYALGVGAGLLAAALLGGGESGFMMELADISFPKPIFVLKKLLFQLKEFIMRVSTTVFLFTLAVRLLSSVSFSFAVCDVENSILATVCKGLSFLLYPMGICDWRAALAAVCGFIAKENVVTTLIVLYPDGLPFSSPAAIGYLCFVALLPPCVAAIAAAAKEVGARWSCAVCLGQSVFALLSGYLAAFCAKIGALSALVSVAIVFVLLIVKNTKEVSRERVHRRKRRQFKRLHR